MQPTLVPALGPASNPCTRYPVLVLRLPSAAEVPPTRPVASLLSNITAALARPRPLHLHDSLVSRQPELDPGFLCLIARDSHFNIKLLTYSAIPHCLLLIVYSRGPSSAQCPASKSHLIHRGCIAPHSLLLFFRHCRKLAAPLEACHSSTPLEHLGEPSLQLPTTGIAQSPSRLCATLLRGMIFRMRPYQMEHSL